MPILGTFVEPGAIQEDHLGLDRSVLTYDDGTARFRHLCDRGRRGVIVCAPALQTGPHGSGHSVSRREDGALTVTPSILCTDCGTHGFITDGQWRDC